MSGIVERHKFSVILAVVILLADQITKWAALVYVAPAWPIEITSYFNLVMVWNTGVSFGMFNDGGETGRWILVASAIAISGLVFYWLWTEHSRLLGFAYCIIIAGAIGNVIDRIRFGAVVDFLDFHIQGYHWPAFNVADSAIVIGAVTIALSLFVTQQDPDNAGEQK